MGWNRAVLGAVLAVAGAAAIGAQAAGSSSSTAASRTSSTSGGSRSSNAPGTSRSSSTPAPARRASLIELDWKELLPEAERAHFTAVAPEPVHDYRGEGGPPAVQTPDFNVNKTLDGATVRLPGFIVPLEGLKNGHLQEFLLVPYFGACIHVPPPPPNQLVFVHTNKSIAIDSIYDAYWITGKLHVQTMPTRLGAAAYSLSAEKIEPYRY